MAIGVAALVVGLQFDGPLLGRSFRLFGHLNWWWVLAGVSAEVGSMASFARQRRRILRSGGYRMHIGSVLAITYAGNAISVSLPIAGSSLSTAYAFGQFASHGAPRAAAAWTLVVAGIISSTAFALLLSLGAILYGNPLAIAAGVLSATATVIPVGALLLAVRRPRSRDHLSRVVAWLLGRVQVLVHRPVGDPAVLVAEAAAQIGALRLARRDAIVASIFAIDNWALDIACLACGIKAVGLRVPWHGLILAWAAGAGAASLNLTPGGLGVVEAALAAALVAVDLPATEAMASVLIYRLMGFWLLLVVGWITYWVVQRHPSVTPPGMAG